MAELFRQPESIAFAVLISLATWASVMAPRVLGAVMPVAAVVALIGATRLRQRMRLPAMDNEVWLIWGLVVSLVGASAFWSPDIGYGVERAVKIATSLAMGIFLFFLAGELKEAHRLRLRHLLVTSFAFGLGLLVVHMVTESALLKWLTDDQTLDVSTMGGNRAAVVTSLLMWPTVMALLELGWTKRAFILPFVTLGVVIVTDSQTAPVVVIAGMIVYGTARLVPRLTIYLVGVIGVAFLVGMPFFFQQACPALLAHDYSSVADTVGARIEIWCAVSAEIPRDWFLGHGIEAARFYTDWIMPHLYFKGEGIMHPHNGALQIWYEFGLIGILLASVIWIMVVRRIALLGPGARAICFAALSSVAVVSYISHGLWQSWWLGAVGIVPTMLRMVSGRVWFSARD